MQGKLIRGLLRIHSQLPGNKSGILRSKKKRNSLMKNLSLLGALLVIALVSSSYTKKPAPKTKKVPAVSKSLTFPVAGKKSSIGSLWGASRDGGRRTHRGIDIFARKGTPVVAISDGIITLRDNTPIGGKTLWLKSSAHGWTAYYAHLDQHLVKEGQRVKKGQVIGTVGKTGNARNTPPHLHFGIAGRKGWVNPLPYVKHSPKVAAKVTQVRKTQTVNRIKTKRKR